MLCYFLRLAGLLLALTSTLPRLASAQAVTLPGTTTPGLTPSGMPGYQGPRYPGGPDSLRAFVARQLRDANPAWVGDVFVRLTLDSLGGVQKADYLVPPPGTLAATLVRNVEVQALVTRLVRRLPRWQPGPTAPGATQRRPETITLHLPFGATGPAALTYSDEAPVFPVPPNLRGELRNRPPSLVIVAQLNVRYPKADIQARTQGKAYGYFEVSETGAVENRRVIGSLSPTMDAEMLRVLALLPAAVVPPRQQGRPVRVYYVLPVTLSIQ